LDAKGAVLPHRPRLPQSSLEATILETVADKDVDVGKERGCGRGPPAFTAGRAPPLMTIMAGRTPALPGMHPATGGGYNAPLPPGHVQAPPYLNLTKRFANWNACYSCGFDVADGHTSQTKPDHDEYFRQQNAQPSMWGMDAAQKCATRWCF
jgi:hypothetical protein